MLPLHEGGGGVVLRHLFHCSPLFLILMDCMKTWQIMTRKFCVELIPSLRGLLDRLFIAFLSFCFLLFFSFVFSFVIFLTIKKQTKKNCKKKWNIWRTIIINIIQLYLLSNYYKIHIYLNHSCIFKRTIRKHYNLAPNVDIEKIGKENKAPTHIKYVGRSHM